ncbi:hypothetical protein ACDQ55_21570 [Chitinophaga sp. 30R24]|uniref:hypothetical protein n=1 Tax=Chitinophaga sp. 30R24 TaxID=3248838 RepID=UPI003B8F6011
MKVETVLIRGQLNFLGNSKSAFRGPIRRGLRSIVWYTQLNGKSTSSSIISDIEIVEGESVKVDMVVLNQLQLEQPLIKGMVLNVGDTLHKFAEFIVEEHLGIWHGGKIP